MYKIGIRIKELREKLRLTQEEFAKGLEVVVTTVSNWERGTAAPPAHKLAILRTKYGVDLNWLLVGEEIVATEVPELPSRGGSHCGVKLLQSIIERIEERLNDAGKQISSPKKASMIALVYDHVAKSGGEVTEEMIENYLKLAL